ncbi:Beta-propeller domain of methanol dehydrogenase type [Bibersteinia trehalosi USDA-ARS-USMARC-190]|uniref:Beta-propeller domain of methanol dehydrogenase type n=1 Tax=Bibersteinia trehalosi USDA-ARS-USMARC-190 TaxID=1263832 RepID=W0R9Q3_BIBTR|nr:TPM domain-containing protein [Bibersteinia trehalosi]AHG86118.1 Beta-propeller domain of methanol dehydrogenase type [Bibersteinia trehalosi USDA-ARS-USMARC-190]
MMKHVYKSLLALGLLLFSLASVAVNYPAPPNPFRYVVDYTKTLNAQEWQTLENALIEYGNKTSSQIEVVIVPTTGGEDISNYTFNLGNKWGIGRKGEKNGILFLIAKNDHKVFIATGYGLEGALPDAIISSIIRHDILPYFRQEQYAQGIAKGLSSIIAATQGEYAALAVEENDDDSEMDFMFFLLFGLIIALIFFPRGGNVYISPQAADRIIRTTSIIHRNGGFGGGSFGSGRSGRSGGGYGGFGGGSFGGGGAGGSW